MRFGWVELIIVLVIVVLIFGGAKLRNLGSDVGGAIKGFKKSMADGEADGQNQLADDPEASEDTVDAATRERDTKDT